MLGANKNLLTMADIHLTQTQPKEDSKPFLSWKKILSKTDGGVIVISGHRGQGKSALGWWLAQQINTQQKKRVVAVGFPHEARDVFPKRGFGSGGIFWANGIEEVDAITKPSVLVCDEASFMANAREAMTKGNQAWNKLINTSRQKEHWLIFIAQNTGQLDIQLMQNADFVLMKKPTELLLRFTREQFKREAIEAMNQFSWKKDSKKFVYAVDYNYEFGKPKMLTSSMPTWWNNKISKAFSTASVIKPSSKSTNDY